MMKKTETDMAERVQENVSNLPLMSVALAGLLGAGLMALISMPMHASKS